ncbi:hypothetical protein [Flavobacterium sp.]|uniref:hypothetical protein n=1 Tax=Flavobacterium sp. TaxID=239 RepID=UPI0037511371
MNTVQKNNNIFLNQKSNNLSEVENIIVNTFLDIELKKERYKNYKDYEIFVIEESLKKMKSIESYLFSLKEWKSMYKIDKIEDTENRFFLDSIKINNLKKNLEKEVVYHWKLTDFKNIRVSVIKNEELRRVINTGAYISLPKRINIFLSKPLIIDEKNAFLSFDIGNGELGNGAINHFTVLMKKINGKWEQKGFYYDGLMY